MNRPYVTVGVGQQHAGGVSSPFRRRRVSAGLDAVQIGNVLNSLGLVGFCALVILAVALFLRLGSGADCRLGDPVMHPTYRVDPEAEQTGNRLRLLIRAYAMQKKGELGILWCDAGLLRYTASREQPIATGQPISWEYLETLVTATEQRLAPRKPVIAETQAQALAAVV